MGVSVLKLFSIILNFLQFFLFFIIFSSFYLSIIVKFFMIFLVFKKKRELDLLVFLQYIFKFLIANFLLIEL